jgi:hypothetical protein
MLRIPQGNNMELPLLQLNLPGKEELVEIGIFYRGRLESVEDGENFHLLLERNKEAEAPVALSPGQIKSLARIMDTTGFNQYAFPAHLTGYNADFQLRTAQVVLINGRPVLRVDGEFKAESTPDAFYGCLYVEADEAGRKVYELYLRASDKRNYMYALAAFNLIAESVEWVQA